MRISDWSSDVCSSDLDLHRRIFVYRQIARHHRADRGATRLPELERGVGILGQKHPLDRHFVRLVGVDQRPQAEQDRLQALWEILGATDMQRLVMHMHTMRSEEHTSELQSLMRISYAVFCLKKKNHKKH